MSLTTKKLQRGTHRSVRALNADLRGWIKTWNDNPRPYVGPRPPTTSSTASPGIASESTAPTLAAAEQPSHRRLLRLRGWSPAPRLDQPIAALTRNQMDVEVEHVLAGCCAGGLEQRDSIGRQQDDLASSYHLRQCEHIAEQVGRDVEQVLGVLLRDNQCVTRSSRTAIEERQRSIRLADHVRRSSPGDDLAENTGHLRNRSRHHPKSTELEPNY